MADANERSARVGFDRTDYAAIAAGGVLGAAVRWLITVDDAAAADGGWFVYRPSTAVTVGRNGIVSGDTVTVGDGPVSLVPWETLTANLLGCFVLGAVLVTLVGATGVRRRAILGAGAGFCGSLTTFSTFAVEIARLLSGRSAAAVPSELQGLEARVDGGVGAAFVYLAVSLGGGAVVYLLGRQTGRLAASWISGGPFDDDPFETGGARP